MATIKLTKVNIGPNKIFSTFNIDGELVTQHDSLISRTDTYVFDNNVV